MVVTGGSDGMGLEFCHKMADKGFNICIISRNEEKMKEKLQEIREKCGKLIKTKYIVADFSVMSKYEDYVRIAEELKTIDIAMLFLNSGWSVIIPF